MFRKFFKIFFTLIIISLSKLNHLGLKNTLIFSHKFLEEFFKLFFHSKYLKELASGAQTNFSPFDQKIGRPRIRETFTIS